MIASEALTGAGLGVSILLAAIALAAVLLQRRQTDTYDHDDAREEAMNLAEIRASTILTLREDIDQLQREQVSERQQCDKAIADLRDTIGRVGSEAADANRLLLAGMRNVLNLTLEHLERHPPDVEPAVEFLRDMLRNPIEGGH